MGFPDLYHYGVATISRLLEITGPVCRISSLLQGSFAKETYHFKEPTNHSHPIARETWSICLFPVDGFTTRWNPRSSSWVLTSRDVDFLQKPSFCNTLLTKWAHFVKLSEKRFVGVDVKRRGLSAKALIHESNTLLTKWAHFVKLSWPLLYLLFDLGTSEKVPRSKRNKEKLYLAQVEVLGFVCATHCNTLPLIYLPCPSWSPFFLVCDTLQHTATQLFTLPRSKSVFFVNVVVPWPAVMDVSCYPHEWVMSHIWTSHVTDMKKSHHAYNQKTAGQGTTTFFDCMRDVTYSYLWRD